MLTHDGVSVLTPEFAAPEQVTRRPVTTATDVYSLGVLLYVLLGGHHPAGAAFNSPAELVRSIVDTNPKRMSDAVVDSPRRRAGDRRFAMPRDAGRRPIGCGALLQGDLDTIVAKALRKSSEDRYPSVSALADDLSRSSPTSRSARDPTRSPIAWRSSRGVTRSGCSSASALSRCSRVFGVYHTARLTAERDRATAEARKSAKVSEVLTDLLASADPFRDKPNPTVLDLLDSGATRLQAELASEPATLGELLTAIGRVYHAGRVQRQGEDSARARADVDSERRSVPSIRVSARCSTTWACCVARWATSGPR